MANAAQLLATTQDDSNGTEPEPERFTVMGQLDKMRDTIDKLLPEGIDADTFIMSVFNEIRFSADLLDIARCPERNPSLWGAILTSAQLGLYPGKATQECWIIARKDKYFRWQDPNRDRGAKLAVWQLGYRGIVALCDRTGRYSAIIGGHAYPGEIVDESSGIVNSELVVNFKIVPQRPRPVHPRHVPAAGEFDDETSGHNRDVTFYVCYALDGKAHYHAMGAEEVYDHYLATHPTSKYRSNAAGRAYGAWDGHYPTMALVSVFRVATRFLPKTTAISQALEHDNTVRTDLRPEALEASANHEEHEDSQPADEAEPEALEADTGGVDVPTDDGDQGEPVPVPIEPEISTGDLAAIAAVANSMPRDLLVSYAQQMGADPRTLKAQNRGDILKQIAEIEQQPIDVMAEHITEWGAAG